MVLLDLYDRRLCSPLNTTSAAARRSFNGRRRTKWTQQWMDISPGLLIDWPLRRAILATAMLPWIN